MTDGLDPTDIVADAVWLAVTVGDLVLDEEGVMGAELVVVIVNEGVEVTVNDGVFDCVSVPVGVCVGVLVVVTVGVV